MGQVLAFCTKNQPESWTMKQVSIRGFFVAPSSSPSSSANGNNEYQSILIKVPLSDDFSSLDCSWLMEAANAAFQKAGVAMRLVGLLNSANASEGERLNASSSSVPAAWMIDPSTKLDTMDLSGELEAVFMCDELSVGASSGKATKIGASDFEFIRLLGEGATCKVFQVKRKKTGKMYAVKVLAKARILGDHKKVAQAMTERKVLVEVRHPFIVQLHWTFQTKGYLYFVLEFCQGGELFYHISKRGRFDEETAKFYFSEVLLGLEYLHNRNILYRDLKLENILLDEEGHVRLTDFGVSKVGRQDAASELRFTSLVGTREYFSPEMIKREGHGKPYDFYCLGCVLYIMLTGSLPYFQGNWTEMYQRRVNGAVLQFPKGVPRLAMDMCARLLDSDPKLRIGSAGGAEEVRQHPWLAGMDWERLYSKQITPPIKPKGNADNFDPMFTGKDLRTQVIGIDESAGPTSAIEGSRNQLSHWSFAEGIDKSQMDSRQYH